MRAAYGNLAFDVPSGFVDRSVIQLIREQAFKDGKPVDPKGYPLNITLNRDKVGKAPNPVLYLQSKLTQLRPRMQGFELDFCEATKVGKFDGAKAQIRHVVELVMVQQVLVWFAGDDLITATMTTLPAGIEEGWSVLLAFAPTVALS